MNIYEGALDYLKTNGWREKGSGIYEGTQETCLLGALARARTTASGKLEWTYAMYEPCPETVVVANIIREQYPEFAYILSDVDICWYFNDSPDTNWEDVERILEKAAAA